MDNFWLVQSRTLYSIFYIKCFMLVAVKQHFSRTKTSYSCFIIQTVIHFPSCLYVLENMLWKVNRFNPC